jgi:hypothetical protein
MSMTDDELRALLQQILEVQRDPQAGQLQAQEEQRKLRQRGDLT